MHTRKFNRMTHLKKYSNITQYQSLIALFIMCAVLSFMAENFMTTDNFWNVMRQISVNVCISVGMTLVILIAGIDLSVGSILAFSGAVAAGLLKHGLSIPSANLFIGFTVLGVVVIGVLVGGALGFVNGYAVTKFKVPPFVATLAMLTMARGFTMLWTGGHPITGFGTSFGYLGTGWFLGVPVPVWVSALVVLIAVFLTSKTRFGRYVYAIGGNESAARLSGVPVKQIKTWVYTLAGMLAAIGGLLVTARLDSAQPNAGLSYELDAIAAVVIGGTSLSGGRGTILGTVLGALIIGVLNNGLVLLDVSPFWQQVVKGMVILLAVIIDKSSKKEA